MKPGDKVKFVGSGWCSVLIGGPGEVDHIVIGKRGTTVWVRVLVEGECLGNKFAVGEVYAFEERSLEVVP